jgi:hypothetical protein
LQSEPSVIAMQNPRRWAPRASVLLLAPVLMVAAANAARAAGCLDEVRSLAQRYHVSSDPPTAPAEKSPPTAAVRPGDLARSGGVIAPPPSPDNAVITPPRSAHDAMPTVPDVKDASPKSASPDSTPPKSGMADTDKLGAAETTALQGVLVAARAQAERGAEAECRDRLREARELIARAQK